ncbi:NB-ARC domain-containing protein [Micromonospora sp. NBC_01740]|uniref:NB-ARC domain-containing protein n=1 Tax=Micromonospora sp. NBC_01740 TaxID=2975986 RepID=UPI002E14CB13|nr:NB-ARC domain-containing protein [Micromonospora sp. NBC_01740]
MGGREAIRGFEYQFLQALEYSLDSISAEDRRATTLFVEEPPRDDPNADAEIVDFALNSDDRCLLAVQVKSGSEASTISASEAVKIILRLVSVKADSYLLLTNRAAGPGLGALQRVLTNPPSDASNLRAEILSLVAKAKSVSENLPPTDSMVWERIARCRIRIDERSRYEVRSALREKVRVLRRRFSDAESVGWDAAGLLLGYLVSEVIAKAAAQGEPRIPFATLKRTLCIDAVTLADAIGHRGWTEYVTVPARQPDIARPEMLEEIEGSLPTPITNMRLPVCVLSGLSGIGKTSLAAAWAADRSDSYAAVLWVDASSTESLNHSFSVIDQWCLAQVPSAKFQTDLKQRIHLALAQLGQPWLLVFDNAIEYPQVRTWLPTAGLGHVLITTTDQTAWSGPRVSKIVVPPMTQDQALNLISTRLVGREGSTDESEGQLRGFVEYLQRWPLALELAAAYLRECYGDTDGIGNYKRALVRALDDENSVPLGYPQTLAAAIRLAWGRMRVRGDIDIAAECASKALWFAAYMSSRHIPVHLLLMCIFLDPKSALQQGLTGPIPYRGEKAQIGEIVRAMRKESLVAVDSPLNFERSAEGPSSLNYTISMNEVVQEVLREEARRSGIEEDIVTQAAFFAQSWLAGLIDAGRYDLVGQFLEQCIALGDYGDHQRFDNNNLALLWGNTAGALMFYEDWHNAERCLRSEMRYLTSASNPDPLIDLQTHCQLAYCILRRAERPPLVISEVTDLLEAGLERADAARVREVDAVCVQISNATAVANELFMDWGRDERVGGVLEKLRTYNDTLPSTGLSKVQNEIIKVNEMLRSPSDAAVTGRYIETLLESEHTGQHTVTLLRLLAEAKAQSHDWIGCIEVLDGFSQAATSLAIAYLDLTNLVLGTAYFTVTYEVAGDPGACNALERALTLAMQYEHAGGRFRPHDRARLLVYQAFLAVTEGQFARALAHVELVDERDLSEAQAGKHIGPLQLYHVICQSLRTCDPALLDHKLEQGGG